MWKTVVHRSQTKRSSHIRTSVVVCDLYFFLPPPIPSNLGCLLLFPKPAILISIFTIYDGIHSPFSVSKTTSTRLQSWRQCGGKGCTAVASAVYSGKFHDIFVRLTFFCFVCLFVWLVHLLTIGPSSRRCRRRNAFTQGPSSCLESGLCSR